MSAIMLSRLVGQTSGLRLLVQPMLQPRLLNGPIRISPRRFSFPYQVFQQQQPAARRLHSSLIHLAGRRALSTQAQAPPPISRAGTGTKKPRRRLGRYLGIFALVLAQAGIATYAVDRFYLGSVLSRSLRAYGTFARVGLDYKLHGGTNAWLWPVDKEELHGRNAQRICNMLGRNGGLYLKAGQAIAIQGGVVPERYREMFRDMFDSAPSASWEDVRGVVEEDFGCSIEDVFGGGVEAEPRASASIAQVHFARMDDGREVAIKVQKPLVAKQVAWDLRTLKLLLDLVAKSTGLPLEATGKFTMDHIMEECDFENEARNASHMAELIASHPSLRDRVYIPKVYDHLSSKRVLTTEWIHGAKLDDKDAITAPYSPSASVVSSRDPQKATSPTGLGLAPRDVMTTLLDLFSAQMFTWGFVHCDPHPGNIFIRRLPTGKPQIVLIDHGLYITLSPALRLQYARFWKALLVQDEKALGEVATAWGMKTADAWADVFTMRPKGPQPEVQKDETREEREKRLIEEARAYLGEEGLFPQELAFLERNLGIMAANNRYFGSPVNRIKMIGVAAMRAVQLERQESVWQSWRSRWVILALDLAFYVSAVRQYFGYGGGFEEDLKVEEDRTVRELNEAMSELFGIDME